MYQIAQLHLTKAYSARMLTFQYSSVVRHTSLRIYVGEWMNTARKTWTKQQRLKWAVSIVSTAFSCTFPCSIAFALPSLPPLPLSTPLNPLGAAGAIDSALQNSPAPPAGFIALSSLPVATLTGGLDQLAAALKRPPAMCSAYLILLSPGQKVRKEDQ